MRSSVSLIALVIILVNLNLINSNAQTNIICNECLDASRYGYGNYEVKQCLLTATNDTSIINKIRTFQSISPQNNGRMTARNLFDEFMLLDCNYNIVKLLDFEMVDVFTEGLAAVRKDNKYGFINWLGDIVIPCEYQDVSAFSNGFAAVQKQGKWGYIDKDGYLVIDPQFDAPGYFLNNMATVEINKKSGVINSKNKSIIPVIYDKATIYNNIVIVSENNKEGLFDHNGNNMIPLIYDYIHPIRYNLAKVKSGDKVGLIDFKGDIVYELSDMGIAIDDSNTVKIYSDTSTFIINYKSGDTTRLAFNYSHGLDDNYYSFMVNDRKGLSDKNGKKVLEPKYLHINKIGNNYIAQTINKNELYDSELRFINDKYTEIRAISWPNTLAVFNGFKSGVIDEKGVIIVPFKYDHIEDFKGGLLKVCENEYCGLIDSNLNIILPLKYLNYFEEISDDRYLLRIIKDSLIDKNNIRALINGSGKYIIEDGLQYYTSINNGMILTEKDGKYGYYDVNGNLVIPFIYNFAGDFNDGLAYVSDTINGYIDRFGNKKIDLGISKEILNFSYNMNYSITRRDVLYGLINKNGTYLLPENCDTIAPFSFENYALFSQNKKIGLIDAYKGIIVAPKYDSMGNLSEGLFRVKLDDKYGFIDRNGKVIIPLIYDNAEEFSGNKSRVVLRGIAFTINSNGDILPEY